MYKLSKYSASFIDFWILQIRQSLVFLYVLTAARTNLEIRSYISVELALAMVAVKFNTTLMHQSMLTVLKQCSSGTCKAQGQVCWKHFRFLSIFVDSIILRKPTFLRDPWERRRRWANKRLINNFSWNILFEQFSQANPVGHTIFQPQNKLFVGFFWHLLSIWRKTIIQQKNVWAK